MQASRSLLIMAALAAAGVTFAQNPTPPPGGQPRERPVLRIQAPGGTYTVALEALRAVSQHEYLVDAVARVTEVNVDAGGALLVRFYFLEPAVPNTGSGLANAGLEQAQRLLKEGAEKVGQADAWKKVVKNYPTTTHARTAEFRVASRDQLNRIFAAADEALRLQRDTRISISGE